MANITKIQVGEETYNISDPINTSAIEKINNVDIQAVEVVSETLTITTKKQEVEYGCKAIKSQWSFL